MARILFADDNIRSQDGHYFEIARLMRDAARAMGYETRLATNREFPLDADTDPCTDRIFSVNRMVVWSLGVDGRSRTERNGLGVPAGGTLADRIWQRCTDRLSLRDRRPTAMLTQWTRDFSQWLDDVSADSADIIVINTADDFQSLALSRALQQRRTKIPYAVHAIFHFAISDTEVHDDQARRFGKQISRVRDALTASSLTCYATTPGLTKQLQQVGVAADCLPYPTRPREVIPASSDSDDDGRLNVLLGGWPRREKGVASITSLLNELTTGGLASDQLRWSLQLPAKKWQRIVPTKLHPDCHMLDADAINSSTGPNRLIELITSPIPSNVYQRWLDTADIGLFMYDPQRYQCRCSAVLLELMLRGTPVVVPDNCWLADRVKAATTHHQVGLIYRAINEVPKLLTRIADDYVAFREAAAANASVIAAEHLPSNTLRKMGISPVN